MLSALDETPGPVVVPAPAPESIVVASSADAARGERMPCPRCAEPIMRAARMCRFCTLDLSGDYHPNRN